MRLMRSTRSPYVTVFEVCASTSAGLFGLEAACSSTKLVSATSGISTSGRGLRWPRRPYATAGAPEALCRRGGARRPGHRLRLARGSAAAVPALRVATRVEAAEGPRSRPRARHRTGVRLHRAEEARRSGGAVDPPQPPPRRLGPPPR